jgi:hypothetical protein
MIRIAKWVFLFAGVAASIIGLVGFFGRLNLLTGQRIGPSLFPVEMVGLGVLLLVAFLAFSVKKK